MTQNERSVNKKEKKRKCDVDDSDVTMRNMKLKRLNEARENEKCPRVKECMDSGRPPPVLQVHWRNQLTAEEFAGMPLEVVERNANGAGPNGMQVVIGQSSQWQYCSNPSGPDTPMQYGRLAYYSAEKNTATVLDTITVRMYPDFSHKRKDIKPEQEGNGLDYTINLENLLNANKDSSKDKTNELTRREKSDTLIEAFGSSKGNRLVRSRKRNALVSEQQKDMEILQAVSESLQQSSANILPELRSSISYLPPYHLDATMAKDAYRLSDLLTDTELKSLIGPAATFIQSDFKKIVEWRQNKTYSSYVLHHLEYLPTDSVERSQKSQVLMYFHFLSIVFNKKAADWKHKNPLPEEIPAILRQKLLDEFTQQNMSPNGQVSINVPKQMKDKLILYMMVFALILDDFAVDFTILETDTGRKLRDYFEQIGCKVSTSRKGGSARNGGEVSQRAVLTTPLTFPQPKGKRGKKQAP